MGPLSKKLPDQPVFTEVFQFMLKKVVRSAGSQESCSICPRRLSGQPVLEEVVQRVREVIRAAGYQGGSPARWFSRRLFNVSSRG